MYTARCKVCHSGTERGGDRDYPQLIAAVTGATGLPMNVVLETQSAADLVAWLHRSQVGGAGDCSTPTPLPGTPTPESTPSPTPTPTPTITPCPGGSLNFDDQGNSTAFGIPAPLVGNTTEGQSQYQTTCVNCHNPLNGDKGAGLEFETLRAVFLSNPFMNGSLGGPVALNDQQIAHLIAYLNRSDTGGCAAINTPTPTATPNPIAQGAAIFAAACASCHALDRNGHPDEMDPHPSLQKIHSALWSGPDEMPQFRELTAGQFAPPYSAQEMALWSYLDTLP